MKRKRERADSSEPVENSVRAPRRGQFSRDRLRDDLRALRTMRLAVSRLRSHIDSPSIRSLACLARLFDAEHFRRKIPTFMLPVPAKDLLASFDLVPLRAALIDARTATRKDAADALRLARKDPNWAGYARVLRDCISQENARAERLKAWRERLHDAVGELHPRTIFWEASERYGKRIERLFELHGCDGSAFGRLSRYETKDRDAGPVLDSLAALRGSIRRAWRDAAAPAASTQGVTLRYSASPDCTSVSWYGKRYEFAPGRQAKIVEVLLDAFRNETPNVSRSKLSEMIDSADNDLRLSHVFRAKNGKGHHPAWKTMIREVAKGVYALIPEKAR